MTHAAGAFLGVDLLAAGARFERTLPLADRVPLRPLEAKSILGKPLTVLCIASK